MAEIVPRSQRNREIEENTFAGRKSPTQEQESYALINEKDFYIVEGI
jgi:hypothetical protein